MGCDADGLQCTGAGLQPSPGAKSPRGRPQKKTILPAGRQLLAEQLARVGHLLRFQAGRLGLGDRRAQRPERPLLALVPG
jgi:hypothetical protein